MSMLIRIVSLNIFIYMISRKEGESGMKGMYDKVPASLKSQLLVKATVEDPEIQIERAEIVKTKTVNELSSNVLGLIKENYQ